MSGLPPRHGDLSQVPLRRSTTAPSTSPERGEPLTDVSGKSQPNVLHSSNENKEQSVGGPSRGSGASNEHYSTSRDVRSRVSFDIPNEASTDRAKRYPTSSSFVQPRTLQGYRTLLKEKKNQLHSGVLRMNIVANRVNILPWTQFWCFLYSGNLYYFEVTKELTAFAACARIEEDYTDYMKSSEFLQDARGCIMLQSSCKRLWWGRVGCWTSFQRNSKICTST